MAGFTRRAEVILLRRKLDGLRPLDPPTTIPKADGLYRWCRKLKTMSPTDVSSNSSYNKSQLKKLVKDHSAKDIKRQIDAIFKRV